MYLAGNQATDLLRRMSILVVLVPNIYKFSSTHTNGAHSSIMSSTDSVLAFSQKL